MYAAYYLYNANVNTEPQLLEENVFQQKTLSSLTANLIHKDQ